MQWGFHRFTPNTRIRGFATSALAAVFAGRAGSPAQPAVAAADRVTGGDAYTAAVPLDVSDRPELLVILDSHGIIYRSYFALREAFASTVRRTGEPVWAVYGYANSLLYVLDELHPTHIIAAWDGPGPTFRHEADADYKATRAPMPDDLKPQLGRVRELLDAFRIPVMEAPGYEADDVLGRWRRRPRRRAWRRCW